MIDPSKTHPQYDEFKDVWKLCRDASTGQRAIKKCGTTYLPKLGGQKDEDYKAYLARALYFNATGRTVDGMTGLIFRKDPTIKIPEALEVYRDDIDMAGTTLDGFAQDCVEEVLKVGRVGVLVDYPAPPESDSVLTIEEARQMGQRPYLTMYKAEAILNWRTGRYNNRTMVTGVFLEEAYEDEEGVKAQIRELFFDGRYGQRVWRQSDKDWVVVEERYPTKQGGAIDHIPFYFCGAKEGGPDVQNPPIESLAYVNIAHYRNSADRENAVHVAGLPTPWVNGITDPENGPQLHLGSNTCLLLPPDATAGFLQCGADGVGAIKEAMTEKEGQMAALGARMLAPEKSQAEAASAHEIKRGGENSVLGAIAGAVDIVLTASLKFMAEWVGANPDDASLTLNKDFVPSPMDAQMLREWVATWQSRGFSYDTFIQGLVQGELLPDSANAEDEIEKMQSDPPPLGTIVDTVV